MKQYTLIALLILVTQPCSAAWDWYVGDFVSYTLSPPNQITHHFQKAQDASLDYRIFYPTATTGHFVGLETFLQEETFNNPDLFTPILGTQIAIDSTQMALCVGVDPRSPIPQTHIGTLSSWSLLQGGITIIDHLPSPQQNTLPPPDYPILFRAHDQTNWHPDCNIGGRWDSLLTQGYTIGIVGQTSPISHTYVWAETAQPIHLFAGFQNLATNVSDAADIQVNFRVNGQVPGSQIVTENQVNVRLLTTAQTPIQQIDLISDGEVVWSASPDTNTFSTAFTLPLSNKHYLRAAIHTASNRTLTSPIFLTQEFFADTLPLSVEPLPLHLSLGDALEALAYLPMEAQARVLSEYLGHEETRLGMALALENRNDMLSDDVLELLAASPYPQVRLGATFVHVMRNSPTLSTHLLQRLSDPDQTLQTYAARMLLQYTSFRNASQLQEFMPTVALPARAYLIHALDVTHTDPELYRHLIHTTRSSNPTLSLAAMHKLTEMGNRSFRVIHALRDSAQSGHVSSLEILGNIGDNRIADDIEKMYTLASPGSFKSTAFRVLQTFYPNQDHYPNRPEIQDKGATPLLDGHLSIQEWQGAAHIDLLMDDAHLGNTLNDAHVWITRNPTHLLFAMQLPAPNTEDAPITLSFATPLALNIPFVFHIPHPTLTDRLTDPTLQLHHTLTDTQWILEGAIAFKDLGLDPTTPIPYLRLNIAYHLDQTPWYWTPTYGQPNTPQRFGILRLHKP